MSRPCRRQRRDLLRYVDEDLSVDRSLDFERHLEDCPSCTRAVKRHQGLEESLLSLPRPLLGDGDRGRLLQGIHGRSAAMPITRPRSRWPRPVALAAAAVFGAVSLWLLERWIPADSSPVVTPIATQPHPVVTEPVTEPAIVKLTPPSLDREAVEARRQLRSEVEQILKQLPPGDWSAVHFFETGAPLAPSRSLIQALENHLDHPESRVARSAARILGQQAREAGLGVNGYTVVLSLERAMRQADRGDDAFHALLAMDDDVVRRTLLRAFDLPHLRQRALLELVSRDEPSLRPTRERVLRSLLRSGEPEDQELLAWALTRMQVLDANGLGLLAELYDEGAPRPALQQALEHLGPLAIASLQQSLTGSGPVPGRSAVQLAGLSGSPAFAAGLAHRASRSRDFAESIDALVDIGGVDGFRELLQLSTDPCWSVSRRSLARDGCVTLLQRSGHRDALLLWACTDDATAARWENIVQIVASVPGSPGNEMLLTMAEDRRLGHEVRSTAGVHLAMRVADSPRPGVDETQALLDLMQREVEAGHDPEEPLLASLLVSLYLVSEEEGLNRGVELLGLDLTRRQEGSLTRLVRHATDRVFSTRYVACVNEISELLAGP